MTKRLDVESINVTLRLTGIKVFTERKLSDDEIRKLIHDRVFDALAEKPLVPGAYVGTFTMEADVESDREFDFLSYAVEALKHVGPDARKRLLHYLVNRFGEK